MLVRLVALMVAVVAAQADEAPTTMGTTGFLASALASMTEAEPAVLTSTQAAMEQNKNRKRKHEPTVEPLHESAAQPLNGGGAVQAGTTDQPQRKKSGVQLQERATALGLQISKGASNANVRVLTNAVEAELGSEARNNAERAIFRAAPKLTKGAQQDMMLSLLENARTAVCDVGDAAQPDVPEPVVRRIKPTKSDRGVYTPDALQKLAQALVDDPDKELLGKDKQYLRAAVAEGTVLFTEQQIAAVGLIKNVPQVFGTYPGLEVRAQMLAANGGASLDASVVVLALGSDACSSHNCIDLRDAIHGTVEETQAAEKNIPGKMLVADLGASTLQPVFGL